MSKMFYTDKELAELMGCSVSLIRKMVKQGPSHKGVGVVDIRLAECKIVGDMRRWRKDQIDKLLGISSNTEAKA